MKIFKMPMILSMSKIVVAIKNFLDKYYPKACIYHKYFTKGI